MHLFILLKMPSTQWTTQRQQGYQQQLFCVHNGEHFLQAPPLHHWLQKDHKPTTDSAHLITLSILKEYLFLVLLPSQNCIKEDPGKHGLIKHVVVQPPQKLKSTPPPSVQVITVLWPVQIMGQLQTQVSVWTYHLTVEWKLAVWGGVWTAGRQPPSPS